MLNYSFTYFSIILQKGGPSVNMKIAVLGATGPTGQQIVTQALAKGFEVRALVRDPDKMFSQVKHEKLKVRLLLCIYGLTIY